VLDENRNGHFNPSLPEEYTTAFTVNAMIATPEYSWGGLVAFLTCFVAFAVFAKRKSINSLMKKAS